MKKFKRALAVLLGCTVCLSSAAFAACGSGDSDPDEGGGNTNTNTENNTDNNKENNTDNSATTVTADELIEAATETVNDVTVSTTGYKLSADISFACSSSDGAVSLDAEVDGSVINQSSLNADLTYASSYSQGGSTEYSYAELLLRDDAYYTKSIASASAITATDGYLYSQTAYNSVVSTIYSSLSAAAIGEAVDGLCGTMFDVLGNLSSTVKATSGGYTLVFDIDGELEFLCTAANAIATYIQSYTSKDITVADILKSDDVKDLCGKYLDGVTGEKIYSLTFILGKIIEKVDEENEALTFIDSLPEGTAEQSAYDYVCAAADALGLDKNVLEDVDGVVTEIKSTVTVWQAAFDAATIDLSLTFSQSKTLSGMNAVIDDLTANGTTIGLDFSAELTAGGVQLKTLPEEYATGQLTGYNLTKTSSVIIYLTNKNAAYLYTYDEDGYEVNSGKSGTYTVDEEGDLATITIDGETAEVGTVYTTIKYDGKTYYLISLFY